MAIDLDEFVCLDRFHKCFALPAFPERGPLRITYAVVGAGLTMPLDNNIPTLLFIPGMFGSRYIAFGYDYLARKLGVRILFIDKPGLGGSDRVPISQRIPTFLAAVPALLDHLHIDKIALASHSAGTLYSLNLLDHMLNSYPTRLVPYIALIAPWVHQSLSNNTLLQLTSLLPNPLLSSFNKLVTFGVHNVGPAIAWSTGVVAASASASSLPSISGSRSDSNANAHSDDAAAEEAKSMAIFGLSAAQVQKLTELQMKYMFAEDTSGGNDEARMCLKKGEGVSWGVWEDTRGFVQRLNGRDGSMVVRMYCAEKDNMSGDKGRGVMEGLWREGLRPGVEAGRGGVDFEAEMVVGTDHDSVISPAVSEVLSKVLGEVKMAFMASSA